MSIDTLHDCNDCGDSIDMDSDDYTVVNVDENIVCEDCASNYGYCGFDPDTLYPRSELRQCRHCRDIFHAQNLAQVSGYGAICNDPDSGSGCLNDSGDFVYCDDVGEYRHVDNAQWSEYDDCYLSEEATRGDEDSERNLYSYDANVLRCVAPSALIAGKRESIDDPLHNRKLFFGVELETDTRGDISSYEMADIMCEQTTLPNFAICKEDSTVSGIEICTLPGDLQSHRETFDWKAWCEKLSPIAKGFHGRDNGIHIHINRRALAPLTLGKMLVFLNNPDHSTFLSIVAQRTVNDRSEWCPQQSKKLTDGLPRNLNYEKYQVLNVTAQTVELRMFNSSLRPDRILKNIEFCHALVRFCEQTSHRDLFVSTFRTWLDDNRLDYPLLSEFVAVRISGTAPLERKAQANKRRKSQFESRQRRSAHTAAMASTAFTGV